MQKKKQTRIETEYFEAEKVTVLPHPHFLQISKLNFNATYLEKDTNH